MRLSTIGYEGAALADFIHTLNSQGVMRVIDIRELPQSRRPGFSKNVLALALSAAGISYEHRKQLGDPKPGRDAARAGNFERFKFIYSNHLSEDASQSVLAEVAQTAQREHCVLLCYERNPKECHRTLVTKELARIHPFEVVHLGVQPKTALHGRGTVGVERHAGA